MYPLYFSAALQTPDGRLMEYGEACVSETEYAVDFTSEFVPLMNLGETARVVRILGDELLEVFTGRVYLSSRKLLKIVGVEPSIIASARGLFSTNVNASVSLALVSHPTHYNLQKADHVSGSLRYLSEQTVKLMAIEYVAEGQHLIMTIREPGLHLEQLPLRVTQRVLLKRSAAVLLCEMPVLDDENRCAIAAYLTRVRRAARKK